MAQNLLAVRAAIDRETNEYYVNNVTGRLLTASELPLRGWKFKKQPSHTYKSNECVAVADITKRGFVVTVSGYSSYDHLAVIYGKGYGSNPDFDITPLMSSYIKTNGGTLYDYDTMSDERLNVLLTPTAFDMELNAEGEAEEARSRVLNFILSGCKERYFNIIDYSGDHSSYDYGLDNGHTKLYQLPQISGFPQNGDTLQYKAILFHNGSDGQWCWYTPQPTTADREIQNRGGSYLSDGWAKYTG